MANAYPVTKSKDGMYHYMAGPGNDHSGRDMMSRGQLTDPGMQWILTQDPNYKKPKKNGGDGNEPANEATRNSDTGLWEGGPLTDKQKQQNANKKERTEFSDTRETNRGRADSDIAYALKQEGLDPTDYQGIINRELRTQGRDLNWKTGKNEWSADSGTNVLDTILGNKRRNYTDKVNAFAPEGYANTTFADTMDDDIIGSILGSQYDDAIGAITRARDRGQLNDTGYSGAVSELDRQRTAGQSRLSDIGGGVLSGYRADIGDIISNARTGASTYDFGSSYNPNTYKTQLNDKVSDLTGRLEGDITSTLGDEQLFDWSSLINKGGLTQGPTNSGLGGRLPLVDAIAERKKQEGAERGLGTQGSF